MLQFLFDLILKKRIDFRANSKRENNEVKKDNIAYFN